jgi:hypothetical protein
MIRVLAAMQPRDHAYLFRGSRAVPKRTYVLWLPTVLLSIHWIANYLIEWRDFSRRWHDVEDIQKVFGKRDEWRISCCDRTFSIARLGTANAVICHESAAALDNVRLACLVRLPLPADYLTPLRGGSFHRRKIVTGDPHHRPAIIGACGSACWRDHG